MGETVGGRYALDGRLGEGGMGQVYRARHLQLGKPFALKIISPAFALDTAARARFNQEAKLASEITHPNIVSVVDFGEDARFGAYMVMELVDGEPLINRGGAPFTFRRVVDVLGQIAEALDHIHKHGIIHGDVKADNIMITAETAGSRRRQLARLLDFGLARRHDSNKDEQVGGSPHYLAPERAAGGPPSVAADIYALGILGYLMLTGKLPFDGNVVEILMAHINERVKSPSKLRGEPIDEALEALVMRALEKDPAKRHPSAAAFRYELNTVMDMLGMGRRRGSGPLKQEAPTSREATLTAAFDRSRVPQALLSIEGTIVLANKAFVKLLGNNNVEGTDVAASSLADVVPGLVRAMRIVHTNGRSCERRARVAREDTSAIELTVVLSPLPLAGTEIHIMIHVEDHDDAKQQSGRIPVEPITQPRTRTGTGRRSRKTG